MICKNQKFSFDVGFIFLRHFEFTNEINGTDVEEILEIINAISTTEFLLQYQYLNENNNRNSPRYLEILTEWYLTSEIELIENDELLKHNISADSRLIRVYNKTLFNNKGNYNTDRYFELVKHL